MKYGITGNTTKDNLWQPLSDLITWLCREDLPFCIDTELANRLVSGGYQPASVCDNHRSSDIAAEADIVLSFGGDGTLLNTAHEVGLRQTPILGINIGRLGFLADIEVTHIEEAIREMEAGRYQIEPRAVLEGQIPTLETPRYALNEFVFNRLGSAPMLLINVYVDDRFLNTYWADGLIVSTPTGSTAYSLSVGGPIIEPASGVLVMTPIAPHVLTVRPIILPISSVIKLRITARNQPYAVTADGRGLELTEERQPITVCKANHNVNLVKLHDQDYFNTLRTKLMWGRSAGRER